MAAYVGAGIAVASIISSMSSKGDSTTTTKVETDPTYPYIAKVQDATDADLRENYLAPMAKSLFSSGWDYSGSVPYSTSSGTKTGTGAGTGKISWV